MHHMQSTANNKITKKLKNAIILIKLTRKSQLLLYEGCGLIVV